MVLPRIWDAGPTLTEPTLLSGNIYWCSIWMVLLRIYFNNPMGPSSQFPQCTHSISHNAPFCNRNYVHIPVTLGLNELKEWNPIKAISPSVSLWTWASFLGYEYKDKYFIASSTIKSEWKLQCKKKAAKDKYSYEWHEISFGISFPTQAADPKCCSISRLTVKSLI